jgi:hypothetical protein
LFAPETIPASSDNCLLSGDAGRGCDWYKIVRMTPDKTTRDACGTRYAFTSYKDSVLSAVLSRKKMKIPQVNTTRQTSVIRPRKAGNSLRTGDAVRGCTSGQYAGRWFRLILLTSGANPSHLCRQRTMHGSQGACFFMLEESEALAILRGGLCFYGNVCFRPTQTFICF